MSIVDVKEEAKVVVSKADQTSLTSDAEKIEVVSAPQREIVSSVVSEDSIITTEHESVVSVSAEQMVVVSGGQQGPVGVGEKGDQGDKGDQGNVGPTGPAGAGASIPVRVTVPVGNTDVIEAIDAAVYRSTKWIITATDQFAGKFRMSEILAIHDDTEARYIHYGMIGGVVSYAVEVVLMAGMLTLRLTNTDANALTIDAVRVGTLATL